MSISNHRLLIKDPKRSLKFYKETLGMTLTDRYKNHHTEHYFLSFGNSLEAALELVVWPEQSFSVAPQPSKSEGYWKFTVAVTNLDETRDRLIAKGVQVGDCFEVPGLAYLCHLNDPDGYDIELIQRTLLENTPEFAQKEDHPLGSVPSLNLSTLRVKDIHKSLPFYETLGMDLVYTYRSETWAMTLYFLIFKQDPKYSELKKGHGIEEQLWQHNTTILELQQHDGTHKRPDFSYGVGPQTGFLGLDIRGVRADIQANDQQSKPFRVGDTLIEGFELTDPDGYTIRYHS